MKLNDLNSYSLGKYIAIIRGFLQLSPWVLISCFYLQLHSSVKAWLVVIALSSIPTDQPLLLPYKPSGSTGMYYVPYLKAVSKMSPVASETSVESSHSGMYFIVSFICNYLKSSKCKLMVVAPESKYIYFVCRSVSVELRTLLSYQFRVSALILTAECLCSCSHCFITQSSTSPDWRLWFQLLWKVW